MLRDIANSKNPLAALIEATLRSKSCDLTTQTVARYEQLMSAAIRMDDGEKIDGGPWAAFLADFPDGSKVKGAVEAIGVSIGASSSEITQFLTMSEGVAAIRAGDDPDVVEEQLQAELEVFTAECRTRLDDGLATVEDVACVEAGKSIPDVRACP